MLKRFTKTLKASLLRKEASNVSSRVLKTVIPLRTTSYSRRTQKIRLVWEYSSTLLSQSMIIRIEGHLEARMCSKQSARLSADNLMNARPTQIWISL